VYLRQSLNKTGEELAIERQREECLALCASRRWTVVGEYVDDDRSASNGKDREDYRRMLADIRKGKIGRVVVAHADRLHRDVPQLLEFTELAIKHNIKLASPSGGEIDVTTDDGEFMAILFAALARKEVRRKGARQRSASKQMAETVGRPWWPSRPFGYDADLDPTCRSEDNPEGKWWTVRRDPSTKKIIAVNDIRKHPTEAKLLKEAYRKFNAGTSIRTLATFWNEKGITSPRGNKWTGAAVHKLLASARNAGLREYDGKVVGKGTWPAIVTEEVYEMAMRRLKDPKRRVLPQASGRKYLLPGIARCGQCELPLGTKISSRGIRQYACTYCLRITRDAAKVDAVVIEAVVRRLSREDAVDLLRPPIEEVDAQALREERRALKDKLGQLGKDFANAPPEFTQAALAEINGRLGEIGQALEDPGKAAIFEDVIGAKDVRKAFLGLDLGRQRTILAALMAPIVKPVGKGTARVFDPDAIEPGWKEDV
jgi:DNA invertase Pin-like site-specific DNA recombinase